MHPVFQSVNEPSDLRQLNREDLAVYAQELRSFIIDTVSKTGGHFAANLGVIELTVALHYVFQTPYDRLIWDVGHQSYPHKVITNRKWALDSIRKWGGISGFPSRSESDFDTFGTGHSSTSLSALAGMAVAARFNQENRNHIAVIGDGALSAGQAFEALNHIGYLKAPTLIILNDNHMGIDPASGALSDYLLSMKNGDTAFFRALGIQYKGPIDGHNLNDLIDALNECTSIQEPILLHIKTTKGKGYAPAEKEQTKWHATGGFDKINPEGSQVVSKVKYQDVAGKTLLHLAETNTEIIAITPAMISGSSLHFLQAHFPDRLIDVGIAEQHAVTFAAGLALGGKRPFCFIYSTFLQRAMDQVIHDVCLQSIPVVFCIDRAGLVGEDGPTHHGVFDLPFLLSLPHTVIAQPTCYSELSAMLRFAADYTAGPIFVRYPRGTGPEYLLLDSSNPSPSILLGKGKVIVKGEGIALLIFGSIATEVLTVANLLQKEGLSPTVVNMRFAKPLDTDIIDSLLESHTFVFTFEESMLQGGVGQAVSHYVASQSNTCRVIPFGIADQFVPHGKYTEQLKYCELDAHSLTIKIKQVIANYKQ